MEAPDFNKPYYVEKSFEPPAPSLIQIIKAIEGFAVMFGELPAAILMGPLMHKDCIGDYNLARDTVTINPFTIFKIPVLERDDVTPEGVFLVKHKDIGDIINRIAFKAQEDLPVEEDDIVKQLIHKYTMEAAKPFGG